MADTIGLAFSYQVVYNDINNYCVQEMPLKYSVKRPYIYAWHIPLVSIIVDLNDSAFIAE